VKRPLSNTCIGKQHLLKAYKRNKRLNLVQCFTIGRWAPMAQVMWKVTDPTRKREAKNRNLHSHIFTLN